MNTEYENAFVGGPGLSGLIDAGTGRAGRSNKSILSWGEKRWVT